MTDVASPRVGCPTPPEMTSSIPRPVLIPLIVATALFMENLDSTVLATALPAIAQSLGENPIRLNLAISSYLLSLAVFIPASGWMADRFGARHVFRIAIGVFMLGSILCGLSTSFFGLVGARILQGIGGAMMVPVGRLVLLRSVQKPELVRRDGLSHPAGADRAGDRAAGRRLHRDLCLLALDLLDQHPDRHPRHRAGDAVHRERPREGRSAVRHSTASS